MSAVVFETPRAAEYLTCDLCSNFGCLVQAAGAERFVTLSLESIQAVAGLVYLFVSLRAVDLVC